MGSITFEGVTDRYNGITVDSQKEPCEINMLLNQLNGKLNFIFCASSFFHILNILTAK